MKFCLLILYSLFTFFSFSQLYDSRVILKNNKVLNVSDGKGYNGELNEYYGGDKKVIGNYKNGLKEGLFVYYSEPRRRSRPFFEFQPRNYIDSSITYSKGIKNGEAIYYDCYNAFQDFIKVRCYYKDGLLENKRYIYSAPCIISKIDSFSKGVLIKSDSEIKYSYDFWNVFAEVEGFSNDTIYFDDSTFLKTLNLRTMGWRDLSYIRNVDSFETKSIDDFKILSFILVYWNDPSYQKIYKNSFEVNCNRAIHSKENYFDIRDIIVEDRFGFKYNLCNKRIVVIKN